MQLPDGYAATKYGRRLDTLEPMFLILTRADGRPVASFAAADPTEQVEAAAWRDHRRRTLRLVVGSGTRAWGSRSCMGVPERTALRVLAGGKVRA